MGSMFMSLMNEGDVSNALYLVHIEKYEVGWMREPIYRNICMLQYLYTIPCLTIVWSPVNGGQRGNSKSPTYTPLFCNVFWSPGSCCSPLMTLTCYHHLLSAFIPLLSFCAYFPFEISQLYTLSFRVSVSIVLSDSRILYQWLRSLQFA